MQPKLSTNRYSRALNRVKTTTSSGASRTGQSSFSRTGLERIAGLYVSNPGGTLLASAGRDVNLVAGILQSQGGVGITPGNTAVRSTDTEAGLAKIFDAAKVQREINAQVQITQAFSKEAPKAVATFSANQIAELKKDLALETDQVKRDAINSEIDKWGEGGRYRVVLHTLAGAFSGGASGVAGAAAIAGSAPLMNQLQDGIANGLQAAGLGADGAKGIAQAIATLTAAGVGAAVGGGQGAAAAATVDANNRQLHPSEQKKAHELASKSGGKYTAKQIEDALRSAKNKGTGESVIVGMVVDPSDRNAIYDKGAVWTVGENGKLIQVLPPQPDADLAAFVKQNTGDTYSWYAPPQNTTVPINVQRDRLTNLPLDDKGRYS